MQLILFGIFLSFSVGGEPLKGLLGLESSLNKAVCTQLLEQQPEDLFEVMGANKTGHSRRCFIVIWWVLGEMFLGCAVAQC